MCNVTTMHIPLEYIFSLLVIISWCLVKMDLAESLLPLQASPDPPGESGMETRDPCLPLRGILGPGHTPR